MSVEGWSERLEELLALQVRVERASEQLGITALGGTAPPTRQLRHGLSAPLSAQFSPASQHSSTADRSAFLSITLQYE